MASPAPVPLPGSGSGSRERILDVATELFGRRGFASVSTREIAARSGLNVATVAHHTGSKGQLYEAVFARLHDAETALLDAELDGVPPEALTDPVAVRALLHALVDAYVDALAEQPAIAGLWSHRWLERTEGGEQIENRYARPLFDRVEALLTTAMVAGALPPLDAHLTVKSVVWMTYGFFTGGLVEAGADSRDPVQVARLRTFVHTVVAGLVGPA